MGSYRILEHPSDLFVEAEGRDFCSFVVALYRGVLDSSLEAAEQCERAEHRIEVQEEGEELLISLLNELIFLLYYKNFIMESCRMENKHTFLITGRKCNEIKFSLEIKSATYHNLEIKITPEKVGGRVLFDI